MSLGCFGPPAFFAIMIWSTRSTVHAALHANLMPHFLVLNPSRMPAAAVLRVDQIIM